MTKVLEQQWSHDETSDNSEDTIASRFERQVQAFPDKLAIVTDEISLTYRELDLKATRIAAALTSLPSSRDQPVVLLMKKEEVSRIAAMLGVLKANRIFIPCAPNSPQTWLMQVIEDSGARHIIVDSSTRLELARTGSVTVLDVEQLAQSSEKFVAQIASPDDAAYIVYTSGSTGGPKGVAISYRSSMRRKRRGWRWPFPIPSCGRPPCTRASWRAKRRGWCGLCGERV